MSNAINGAWILAVVLVVTAYYFDIGGIKTSREDNTAYLCTDKETMKPYHSKRNVSGDNCTPLAPININPDIIAGIKE